MHPAQTRRVAAAWWTRALSSALAALVLAATCPGAAQAQAAAKPQPAASRAGAARPLSAKPANATQATPAASPDAGYTTGPTPAWVQPGTAGPVPAELPRAPMVFVLVERQTRLEPQGAHRYFHAVRHVHEAAGLQQAAQMEVEFDPAYQRLVVHQIDVVRDGQRIAKLPGLVAGKGIKLLHRETNLERQMVDGRMTASIVLDDVRVGDRVDWSYSLVGSNPVFGGKFVEMDWSVAQSPMSLYQYRLLTPPERTVRHQLGDPAVTVSTQMQGAWRETLFQRRLAPQFSFDPNLPASVFLRDQIQMSEFADWAEVSAWADKLFAPATQAGPEVKARAAALAARSTDTAERLRLALDLVQTEVRYFGTEIGANSHQPVGAETVLKQRFGDCKDKTSLLTAVLGAMDMRATPLLVSTRYQRHVQTMLPSPLAFDHVIAGVELGGKTLWLDSTRSLQTGAVASRQSVGLGFGLPARAGNTALQALPSPVEELRLVAEDTFRFTTLAEDAVLETRHTYHGDMAEWVRGVRASQPAADFERQMAAEYNRMYPSAAVARPLEIIELPDRNALTVVQQFKLVAPWRFPQQKLLQTDFAMPVLMSALRLPDQSPRTQPLRLAMQGVYRQTLVFQFGEPMFARTNSSRFDETNGQFRLAVRSETASDTMRLEGELTMLSDQLEPADWSRYREQLIKVWPRLGNTLQVSAMSPAQFDKLKTTFAQLDDDLRRGRIKASTAVQREAWDRLAVLDEQLASNRLSPKLRAETLVARGENLDHLGRLAEAQKTFEQAVALDPTSSEARSAAAINALLRRADAQAIEHVEAALKLAPSEMGPRYTRGHARYFQQDWAAARDEFTQILAQRSEVERSYATVWLILSSRRAGSSAQDVAALAARFAPTSAKPGWPHPITRYLVGDINLDEALLASRDANKPDPGRLCELYYYAAEKALIDGDKRRARQLLVQAIDTGVIEFNEHAMARRVLDKLDAGDFWR